MNRTITVLIPAFGAAEKLEVCLTSLDRFLASQHSVFVLDDATPDASIRETCARHSSLNLQYVRSERNQGFVTTCNCGWNEIVPQDHDLLLLNSDTEITCGSIQEMLRVLYLHERHGVVCPRSNNATIFSVPLPCADESIDPRVAYEIWRQISSDLPQYGVMPSAVGFCMLIKAEVLRRFGLFDEIYSPGYNEENDFTCRINRYGFSAVAANRAFVFHYESSSFGNSRRKELDAKNRKTLIERYPEFERSVAEYFEQGIDSVERFAILRQKHRPKILYDLFHLPAKHCGTSEFGLSLLRELYPLLRNDCDLYIGLGEKGRFFLPELSGYQIFEDRPSSNMLFDLAFKPSQIFMWADFKRMARVSPRLAYVVQDIIAVRCNYLGSADRATLFERTAELADQVFFISEATHSDFTAFFQADVKAAVIHHGSDLEPISLVRPFDQHILLIGNEFVHKGIKDVLPFLLDVGPVAVLGGESPDDKLPTHVRWFTSGRLTRNRIRELFVKSSLIIFPSSYEGYGLPVVHALALGKPVIALDTEVNRELMASMEGEVVLFRSPAELPQLLEDVRRRKRCAEKVNRVRRWKDVASDYANALTELLRRPQDVAKLRARGDLIRLLDASRHP